MLLMLFMFVLREGITYVIPWVILRDCSSPHHLLCHTDGPGKDHVVFFVPPAIPFASHYQRRIPASHNCIAQSFIIRSFVNWLELDRCMVRVQIWAINTVWCMNAVCIINQPCLAHTTSIYR